MGVNLRPWFTPCSGNQQPLRSKPLNQGANSGNGRIDSPITRGGGWTMALRDYRLILGVSRTETARGIQNTFRDLVKKLHPDRVGPQGTAAFQDLVEAYQVLSDPERRQAYRHQLL